MKKPSPLNGSMKVSAPAQKPVLSNTIEEILRGRGEAALKRTRRPAPQHLAAAIFVLGLLLGIGGTAAQEKQDSHSQGLFLVARRGLSDPLFAKSIVLMLPIKGTPLLVGLIVNKPTRVRLRDLFADSPALEKRDATAYFGGPVDVQVGARSAIFRSATAPKNATLVFGDVYVTFDPDTIAALVENVEQASSLRVFLGRAQWAPAQLENEIARGGWYSLRADADPIFSKFPEAAWHTLLDRAEPRPLMKYEQPIIPLGYLRFPDIRLTQNQPSKTGRSGDFDRIETMQDAATE